MHERAAPQRGEVTTSTDRRARASRRGHSAVRRSLIDRAAAWWREGWNSYTRQAEYGIFGWEGPTTDPEHDRGVLPAAVFWDMDGTLADTESHWTAARANLAREHGIPWGALDSQAFIGAPLTASAAEMRRRGLPLEDDELIDEIVTRALKAIRSDLRWRPGALELLSRMCDAGTPCALVTMAYKSVADFVAESAHPAAFQAVIAGNDVIRGKPHPEPYLRAVGALRVNPADCLAIEDTRIGAESATAAGIPTLVISDQSGQSILASTATRRSLEGISYQDLANIKGEAHARLTNTRPLR